MSEWKKYPSNPNYSVSTDGEVQSHFKSEPYKLKKHVNCKTGYEYLIIQNRKHVYIHTMVLETFVGPRPEGCVASHQDGIRTHNNLNNLKWETYKQNMAMAAIHGTVPLGEQRPCSKLTSAKVTELRKQFANGNTTIGQLSREYGVHRRTLSDVINRKTWAWL